MFDKKSDYAQNKRDQNSIIYISVSGQIRLTRADFASEDEFQRWKSWSDADYHESEKRGRGFYDNGIPLDDSLDMIGAVLSAEDKFFQELLEAENAAARKAQQEARMQIVKDRLTPTQYHRLWLLYAEGKSITEIAAQEGISKASISRCINAARKKFHSITEK